MAALLQSPVSSVSSLMDRTPSLNSRRRLFPGPQQAAPAAIPSVNTTPPASEAMTKDDNSELGACPSVEKNQENKPKRTGSLGLFFRKVCTQASVVLQFVSF